MLITTETATKVKVKRAILDLGKVETAKKLHTTTRTLAKIEKGNYDAPKRIYESVMNWLIEDLQKTRQKILVQNYNKGGIYGNY